MTDGCVMTLINTEKRLVFCMEKMNLTLQTFDDLENII